MHPHTQRRRGDTKDARRIGDATIGLGQGRANGIVRGLALGFFDLVHRQILPMPSVTTPTDSHRSSQIEFSKNSIDVPFRGILGSK